MAKYNVENIKSVDEILDNNTNEDLGIQPMIFAPDEPRVTVTERVLNIPDELQTIGVENDNNVERIYFEIPRYFDEVNDLSKFTIYINYLNANQEPNKYHCTDVEVEGENIVFSWLTSEHVYSYRGTVRFIVYAVASDNRKWNSTVAELFVMEGLETEGQIIDNNPDIINELINLQEQFEEALDTIEQQQSTIEAQQSTISSQQTTITNQQNKITEQQEQIDDSIEVMGDYEIVQDNPTQIRFKKGDGTYGDTVNLGDNLASKSMVNAGYDTYSGNSYSGSASDYGIEVSQIIGAYEQEGTPTPDAPIEPQFVEINNFNTNGGNLFDASKIPTTSKGGATVTNNGDGSFTVNGSGSLSSTFSLMPFIFNNIKKGMLYVSVDNITCPYVYTDVYWGKVYKRTLTNNDKKIVSTEITQEDIDNNVQIRVKIFGGSGKTIIGGTFKLNIYQDGDGTWYPYNVSNLPLNKTYRALPNGVYDYHRDGIDTFNIGYVEFDGSSDENWKYGSEAKAFYTPASEHGAKYQQFILCDRFGKASGTEKYENKKCAIDRVNLWFKYDSLGQSVDAWKKWLQSNPIKVWYELETPTTEQNNIILKSFYPFTNAWHDSEVEASDLTWNILTQSKSNEDKINDLQDEMDVVNKRFQVRQLLVNPDFQINQRGQSSYTESLKYTVDMWRTYLAKVNVLSNGVRVTSTNSSQKGFFTQLIDRINGEHTISLKANNKVHSFSFTPSSQQQRFRGDVFNVFVWNQDGKQTTEISIEVDIGNSVEIEYINLFEGDIVYPRVKESYQDDLMECQLIVKPLDTVGVVTYEYGQTANQYYYTFDVAFEEMIGKPTISNINAMYFSENGTPTYITPIVNGITKNNVKFQTPRGARKNIYSNGIKISCLLSCEPL